MKLMIYSTFVMNRVNNRHTSVLTYITLHGATCTEQCRTVITGDSCESSRIITDWVVGYNYTVAV